MKKANFRVIRENMCFLAVTAVLVLFIAACVTLTVKGNEGHGTSGYNEDYYDLLEENYKEQIAEVLNEYGMGRSGVNLTKITLEDGSREYALMIYNSKFLQMDSDKMQNLESALCSVTFPQEACHISISLQGM